MTVESMLHNSIPLPKSYDSITTYTDDFLEYVKTAQFYKTFGVGEIHILDLFTTNSYEQTVPNEWREYFGSDLFSFETFLAFVVHNGDCDEAMPFSLNETLLRIKRLSFNRECTEMLPTKSLQKIGESPKKLHETDNFSFYISKLAKQLEIKNVVDFGSGAGFLVRGLAFGYGLSAVGLERRQTLIRHSEKLDKIHSRQIHNTRKVDIRHIQQEIDGTDLSDVLKDYKNCLAVSIHSCGDLTWHALSALSQPSFKAVAIVGCCYNSMKIFPYSKKLSPCTMSTTAKMIACQAPQNWTKETSENFFKRHFYRALLQRLMADMGLLREEKRLLVGSLRSPCFESFAKYTRAGMGKLDMESNVTEEAVRLAPRYEESYASRFMHVKILWTLICACSALLESCILLDRYYFMMEQPQVAGAQIINVFDQTISPRNMAVVAWKF